jgi:hypothetical protein
MLPKAIALSSDAYTEIPTAMKLLIDTDAFCKLGIAGLLPDAIRRIFDAEIPDCGRLAALPYMLRKGGLRRKYGEKACDDLISLADSMPVLPAANTTLLEKLVPIDEIDPGEAQILASAAGSDLIVLTGDKRAVRALTRVDGVTEFLSGRIAVLEAILLALHNELGEGQVRKCIAPLTQLDQVVKICFSEANPNAREGLLSYYGALAQEVKPLRLWDPQA